MFLKKIDSGLFRYSLTDYHAILCVPLDADVKEIRKRYLQIARILHPDSCIVVGEANKDIANQLLSKMVNVAYEKLSVERNLTEHLLILAQTRKRVVQEAATISFKSELAQQLIAAPNVAMSYKQAIAQIAKTQFSDLQQVNEIIGQISELNVVYLMRMGVKSTSKTLSTSNQPANTPPPPPNPPTTPPKPDSIVEQYLRRAQVLLEKNQLSQAKVELQDALKLEPKNSHCHSLIAMVYLRQNQLKMAKIHFDNALKLNPKEPIALEWKPKVDQALGITSSSSQVSSSSKKEEKQSDKSGNGGLFGGLFGGKKK
ncbi:MAG: DnaJ domain-containing protein [Cuspidothrix sp.]